MSIGLGAVSSADASALVKVGSTTVLAGIKCEVMRTADDRPNEGQLAIEVEMAPLCSAEARPGRSSEAALVLADQMSSLLSSDVLDLKQLCIDPGKAAWAAYVDVYVLDADGSLHDACLLAITAALSTLHLPRVVLNEEGNVVPAGSSAAAEPAGVRTKAALQLTTTLTSTTCALHKGKLLVDPTFEEEKLVEAVAIAVVDEHGELVRLSKPGGGAGVNMDLVHQCHEAAKARGAEMRVLLRDAIAAREQGS